jgi:hypothetical protein
LSFSLTLSEVSAASCALLASTLALPVAASIWTMSPASPPSWIKMLESVATKVSRLPSGLQLPPLRRSARGVAVGELDGANTVVLTRGSGRKKGT